MSARDRTEDLRFAQAWQAAWNSHDLPCLMAHYAPQVEFRSARAAPIVGTDILHGKDMLETYWRAALARQPDLRFTVEDVYSGPDMLVLRYRNQNNINTVETLCFDPDGLVCFGAACRAGDA